MFVAVMRATDEARRCHAGGRPGQGSFAALVRVGIVLRASAMHHADNL